MTVYSLGYAKRTGIKVFVQPDEGKAKTITVKSKPVGNMFAPNPDDFVEKVINVLEPGDIVLTPSGPNHTYVAGCAKRATVFWANPGTLVEFEAKTPKQVLELFETNPDVFYKYIESGIAIDKLRIRVGAWMTAEKDATRSGNAHTQFLKREQDFFRYHTPLKAEWIAEFVAREKQKAMSQLRSMGVNFDKDQKATLLATLQARGEKHYDKLFGGTLKDAEKELKAIKEATMEYFGIDILLEDSKKAVERALAEVPENDVFDGLLSAGSTRTRALIIGQMRNPLMYPAWPALQAFAGIGGIRNGQAPRRMHGELLIGRPDFKKLLVYVWPVSVTKNDPEGFFKELYFAYKAQQWHVYYDLVMLTKEVFKALGKKEDNDETVVPITTEDVEETPIELKGDIVSLIDRLAGLSDLPMIAKNGKIKAAIAQLQENPDPALLWKVFSKASKNYNLQMTPSRINQQAYRMLGTVLLQAIYYRWLKRIDQPLPLESDYVYRLQYKAVTGNDEVPTEHDHKITLEYFKLRVAEMRAERPLPPRVQVTLVTPTERLEYLRGLSEVDAWEALSALSDKDAEKFAKELKLAKVA